jgi:tRNA(fMet)-specific endonuclease VapC
MRLLDTSVCVAWLDGRDLGVKRQLASLKREDLCLCSVVKAELLYGARASARVRENLERLQKLFALFPSLPFDDDASEHYGALRAQLRRAGTPIGGNDMLIASIALAADATLVTRNEQEFRLVPGLRVEVW